ncbi:hypothetical protein AVEN_53112-1 [Araneus ventricosus]|uniref:Uncharacterized protein n=1 Tax=Araneus ventricosus TaxID=182803 RepID=A0A4Y2WRR4_ARAVE|nr:hypothetical protein AVEN_53112-1 [Araneus ventricosus]
MAWWYPSCICVVNGFASISSFLESCSRISLHIGFLQISTKRRRGTCLTNLSQDERSVSHVAPYSGGVSVMKRDAQTSRTCHVLGRCTLWPTVPRFRLWMSSYVIIVGSPHVKLLLNCR